MSTGTDRIRPKDVRNPLTVEEAAAAVGLAASKIESIQDQLEDRDEEEDDDWRERANGMLEAWSLRLGDLNYWLARLQAGELPLSVELARLRSEIEIQHKRADDAHKRADAAQRAARLDTSEEASLKKRCVELQRKNDELVVHLNRATSALELKNAVARSNAKAAVPVENTRRMYVRIQWELLLKGEVALLSGGGDATTMLRSAASDIPLKFRAAWNAGRIAAGLTPGRGVEDLPANGTGSNLDALVGELMNSEPSAP